MITFKAAVLEQLNSPLIISDVSFDDNNLQVGQVLVKILSSGLCGAQLQEIEGLKGNEKFLPHLLGHEGCGIVEKIGPGVTTCKKWDKVILHWRKGAGIEAPFPQYQFKGRTISSGKVTTLSEYAVVSENRLTSVRSNVDNHLCTLLGCGLSTALSTVNKVADIKIGESVLVLGCGGVGTAIVKACAMVSAGFILGVDRSEVSREITMIDSQVVYRNDIVDWCDLKFDCVIDTTGSMELVSRCLPYLTDRGRVILVSQPKAYSGIILTSPANLFLGEGQVIRTTQGGSVDPQSDFPRYIKALQKNNSWRKLISREVTLDGINEAVTDLRNGIGGRTIINFHE